MTNELNSIRNRVAQLGGEAGPLFDFLVLENNALREERNMAIEAKRGLLLHNQEILVRLNQYIEWLQDRTAGPNGYILPLHAINTLYNGPENATFVYTVENITYFTTDKGLTWTEVIDLTDDTDTEEE